MKLYMEGKKELIINSNSKECWLLFFFIRFSKEFFCGNIFSLFLFFVFDFEIEKKN